MQQAVQTIFTTFGHIDIVVANAGVSNGGAFEDQNEQAFKDIMDVNVTGVANTVHATLPHLKNSTYGGRIVTISSVAGRRGVDVLAAYSASKWAVIGLTKSLALDLGRHNITVNSIAPTAIKTSMWHGNNPNSAIRGVQNSAMEEYVKAFHSLPTGSLSPDEIANAAAFLASDNAKYISGTTLDVNAGWSGQLTG